MLNCQRPERSFRQASQPTIAPPSINVMTGPIQMLSMSHESSRGGLSTHIMNTKALPSNQTSDHADPIMNPMYVIGSLPVTRSCKSNGRKNGIMLIGRIPRALVLALLMVAPTVAADGPAKAPALTSEQRKDILLASKDVELWQLRTQQAAAEFEKARATLQKLVASLTPAGYTMTDKLELVPEPAKEPAK
jgi:hypothetical protein